jgi:hypothetical protein
MEINKEALSQLSVADLLAISNEHKSRAKNLSKSGLHIDAAKHWSIANAATSEYNERLNDIFIF